MPEPRRVLAIFGPTSAGKTTLAIAVAELLRDAGDDPVAISCDAIQLYRGLETISGAAGAGERARLEHRLIAFADPAEEFSAGRFAILARAEIDGLLDEGRTPIVVGGTGLYMRAALAELDLKPEVPVAIRAAVEVEITARGPAALHAELPADVRERIDPGDRKRIARSSELIRIGEDPPERSDGLWTSRLRRPTLTVAALPGRDELDRRIDRRVEAMAVAGAIEEAKALDRQGISRTARAALGFDAFINGDVAAVKAAHRRYARRQLTWLRKMGADLEVDPADSDAPALVAGRLRTAED